MKFLFNIFVIRKAAAGAAAASETDEVYLNFFFSGKKNI